MTEEDLKDLTDEELIALVQREPELHENPIISELAERLGECMAQLAFKESVQVADHRRICAQNGFFPD